MAVSPIPSSCRNSRTLCLLGADSGGSRLFLCQQSSLRLLVADVADYPLCFGNRHLLASDPKAEQRAQRLGGSRVFGDREKGLFDGGELGARNVYGAVSLERDRTGFFYCELRGAAGVSGGGELSGLYQYSLPSLQFLERVHPALEATFLVYAMPHGAGAVLDNFRHQYRRRASTFAVSAAVGCRDIDSRLRHSVAAVS